MPHFSSSSSPSHVSHPPEGEKLPLLKKRSFFELTVEILRLHSLEGGFVVVLPALWMLIMIAPSQALILSLLVFLCLGFLARGAGCIINDIADRHIDPLISRTKNRPLASGDLKVWQALLILGGTTTFLLLGVYQLSYQAKIACVIAVPFIIVYPFTKRFLVTPQLFLGVTLSFAVVVAYFQFPPPSDPRALNILGLILFFLGIIFWVFGYDTIYALQDREEDEQLKVNSSAIFFRQHLVLFISVCYLFAAFLLSLGSYYLSNSTAPQAPLGYIPFHLTFISVFGLHLLFQVLQIARFEHQLRHGFARPLPEKGKKTFASNAELAIFVTLCLLLLRGYYDYMHYQATLGL